MELNCDKEREVFEVVVKKHGADIKDEVNTPEHFKTWCFRAEIAQAEEAKLQAQITELQQKLANYENPDYVLVPRNPTNAMIGAGQDSEDRQLYHYEVSSVWGKMIEEVEKSNERNH